ncbi:hypothetical protein GBA52_029174 [Prunus armeniaca]|nr:hypothetical protein GBA52_029174 [Prunus armeniaca]
MLQITSSVFTGGRIFFDGLHFRAGLAETACTSGRPIPLPTSFAPRLAHRQGPTVPLMCAHVPQVVLRLLSPFQTIFIAPTMGHKLA